MLYNFLGKTLASYMIYYFHKVIILQRKYDYVLHSAIFST